MPDSWISKVKLSMLATRVSKSTSRPVQPYDAVTFLTAKGNHSSSRTCRCLPRRSCDARLLASTPLQMAPGVNDVVPRTPTARATTNDANFGISMNADYLPPIFQQQLAMPRVADARHENHASPLIGARNDKNTVRL